MCVTVAVDIMFVNKLPFSVSISRNIKFCTAQLIPDQKHKTLTKAVRDVRATYEKGVAGRIKTLLMDGVSLKQGWQKPKFFKIKIRFLVFSRKT
jgi:hypothetical protein